MSQVPAEPLEIAETLVLSTGHISFQTSAWLDRVLLSPDDSPIRGGDYGGVGWFLYAHEVTAGGNIPADLMKVFDFANANGCDYILLDADALTVENLEVFKW